MKSITGIHVLRKRRDFLRETSEKYLYDKNEKKNMLVYSKNIICNELLHLACLNNQKITELYQYY